MTWPVPPPSPTFFQSIAAFIKAVYTGTIAVVAAPFSAAGFSEATSTAIATYVVDSAIVYGITRLLASDPFDPNQGSRRSFAMRPNPPRICVYGRAWLSPTIVSQTADHRALYLVTAIADHKLKELLGIQVYHQQFFSQNELTYLKENGWNMLMDNWNGEVSEARTRIYDIQKNRWELGSEINESGAAYSHHPFLFAAYGFDGQNISDFHDNLYNNEPPLSRPDIGRIGVHLNVKDNFLPMKAGTGSGAPLGFYNMRMDGTSWMTFSLVKIPDKYLIPTWQGIPPISVEVDRGNVDLKVKFLWSDFKIEPTSGLDKKDQYNTIFMDLLRKYARVMFFAKELTKLYEDQGVDLSEQVNQNQWDNYVKFMIDQVIVYTLTDSYPNRERMVWESVNVGGSGMTYKYPEPLDLEIFTEDYDIAIKPNSPDKFKFHHNMGLYDDAWLNNSESKIKLSDIKKLIYEQLMYEYYSNGNVALCIVDFLSRYTMYKEKICGVSRIDIESALHAAQCCEDNKDANGNRDPLTANGAMPVNRPDAVLQQLTMAMNMGSIVESGGIRYIYAGKPPDKTIKITKEDILLNQSTGEVDVQLNKTSSVSNRASSMDVRFIDQSGASQVIGLRSRHPYGIPMKRTTIGSVSFAFIDNREHALQLSRIILNRQWLGSVVSFPLCNPLKVPRPNDVLEIDIPTFTALPSKLFRVTGVSNSLSGVVTIQAVNESPNLYVSQHTNDVLSELPPPDFKPGPTFLTWDYYGSDEVTGSTVGGNVSTSNCRILIHPTSNASGKEKDAPGGAAIGASNSPKDGEWGDVFRIN